MCNCKKKKTNLTKKDGVYLLAVQYAKANQCDVVLYYCADWEFCCLSDFDFDKQIYEIITYDNSGI